MQNRGLMYQMINALEKSGDATLAFYLQKEKMKRDLFDRQMKQQLAEEVAEIVMSRMSATIDAEELVKAIKELDVSIDDLGR